MTLMQPVAASQQDPKQAALQGAINRQQQTPYAAQNGMNKTAGQAVPMPKYDDRPTQRDPVASAPGKQYQTTMSPSSGTGVSPVTADGRINQAAAPPPAPPPAPTNVEQPAAAAPKAQPMTPGEAAAAGLGWVPPDHPLYGTPGFVGPPKAAAPAPAAPQQPGAPQGPAAPVGPTTENPWGPRPTPTYEAGSIGDPNTIAYHNPLGPDRMGDTEYKPGTITQNPGTVNQGLEDAVQGALVNAIAGGGGLAVEQLKGRHLDNTMSMRDDNLAAAKDAAGASGRLGGGFAAGQDAILREQAIQNALGGFRDIDIADAEAKNENLYRGIEAGNNLLTGQSTRKLGDYAATIEGQMKQEDLLRAAAGNSRDNYIADLGGAGAAGQIGASTTNTRINADSNNYGARLGLLGDILNIMERARQSDQSTGLGYSQLLGGLLR